MKIFTIKRGPAGRLNIKIWYYLCRNFYHNDKWDRFIFTMGIPLSYGHMGGMRLRKKVSYWRYPYMSKDGLYVETGPWPYQYNDVVLPV